MKTHWIIWGLKCAALALGAVLLFGFVTMQLWNWVVPPLFSGPSLGFWQALGIMALARILFGGFRGWHRRGCCGSGGHWGYWKHRMSDKMSSMTPEEREKYRQEMYDRCCGWENKKP